ncbi:MAG: SpoIVB peptidase S55 domain-containing protein, partial [Eubacteriales bacterium]|nr:SpoIVB peptidase S55 domain-containing protein [Eubacteriales bacterium]
MRKFWYRRILMMILVLSVSVGGSYFLLENQKNKLEREVSAGTSGNMVIPGGMPIGIYLETEGVLVLGTEAIEGMDGQEYEPAAHLVKEGDYIVGFNDEVIEDKSELIAAVKSLNQEDVILKVMRGEQAIDIRIKAVQCAVDDYKLGIWVRDNAQGLGTITYLTADSEFGALGHGIHDTDTGELLDISKGVLYTTSIRDIQKGENGVPGGMEGIIVYNNYNMLGSITENSEEGIYGTLDRIDTLFHNAEPVETASAEEIEEGEATIRCSVEGKVEDYQVQITGVNPSAKEVNKTIELEVTDEKLLELTGGIVQGMSGSPILQNGKLIGAVTHVFVNNPAKGYGILIE